MSQYFKYTVYGLTLQVNQPLTGVMPADDRAPVDVVVDLNGKFLAPSLDVEAHCSGVKVLSEGEKTYFHLWFQGDGLLDFKVDVQGRHISATWPFTLLQYITTLLLGPVLSCVLRLRGILCLHACVVKVGKYAIAILGDSGAGKSTTAGCLAQQGYAILSDDLAALKEDGSSFLAQPGYPRLRLWPNSLHKIYGSEKDLEQVLDFVEKRFINLSDRSSATAWRFYNQPLPLAAIYILGKRQRDVTFPKIEPMSPTEAVMQLMAQRSLDHLPLDQDKQAREFAGLSRVAMTVPVRKVTRRDSLEALPQLCDAILQDVTGIARSEKCAL